MFRRLGTSLLRVLVLVSVVNIVCHAQSRPLLTHHVRGVTLNGQARSVGRLPAGQPIATAMHAKHAEPAVRRILEVSRNGQKSFSPSHRSSSHPAGLPPCCTVKPMCFSMNWPRPWRRHAQRIYGIGDDRSATHHRRLRNAQAPTHRRRGSTGNHHAPLRTLQYAAHIQPPCGGLGQAARRRGRGDCDVRLVAASRSCSQVRSTELAHETTAGGSQ
jgi:hypothetical protein